MKCINCGKEFEGNFCPVCGTKAAPQNCPKCGKTRAQGERFCSNCGYSFIQQPQAKAQQVVHSSAPNQKIASYLTKAPVYKIFKLLPTILFSLFSVLLFIFFATPVAIMPGGEILGETIPSESYGNVYSFIEDFPSLQGSMTVLIVFAVIALLYACFMVAQHFMSSLNSVTIKFKDINIPLWLVLACLSEIFLLIFFITGCTVCGKIAAEDGGLEIIAAGACPILVIVFSVIFLILSAAAVMLYILIRKKFPSILQNELRIAEYVKAHPVPKKPSKPKKPKNPELKAIDRYIRLKKITKSILLTIIIGGIWVAIASVIVTNIRFNIQLQWILLILPIAIIVLAMAIYVISSCLPIKKHTIKNVRKSGSVTLFGILFFFLSLACLISCIGSLVTYLNGPYYHSNLVYSISIPLFVGFLVFLSVGIFYIVATRKLKRKVVLIVYGEEKPSKNSKTKITGEQLDEEQRKFKQAKAMGKELKEKFKQQYEEYCEVRKKYLQDLNEFKRQQRI